MKKSVLALILLFYYTASFTQNYFNNKFDINNQGDGCASIVETENGYIVEGFTAPPRQIFLMFLNKQGELLYYKFYQKPNYSYYNGSSGSIIKTNLNNYAISGTLVFPIPDPNNPSENYTESLLMLSDNNGDTLCSKTYCISDSLWNSGMQCKQTSDSGFIIVSRIISSYSPVNGDFLLIKTDRFGNKQWHHIYGDNKRETAFTVIQTPDKGYLMGGEHLTSGSPYMENDDAKIIKTDSLGNEKWSKLFGGIYDDYPAMVCLANDSNYMIAFAYCTFQTNTDDGYKRINIIKTDTAGNVIWNKKYGTSLRQLGVTICPVKNSGYIVTGYYNKSGLIYAGFLMRINENGDSLWYREYYYNNQNQYLSYLIDVIPTTDNGFASCGEVLSSGTNSFQDAWVIKTDSFGCLEADCTVGVTEIIKNKGMAIYPNPARDKITFKINQKDLAETKLVIYNIQGQILMQKNIVQNNTEIDV